MVLGHFLASLILVVLAGQFKHADGDLGGFGEEIFERTEGPTQGHFLLLDQAVLLVLDYHLNHPCPLLILSGLDFLLNDFLDLLLL